MEVGEEAQEEVHLARHLVLAAPVEMSLVAREVEALVLMHRPRSASCEARVIGEEGEVAANPMVQNCREAEAREARRRISGEVLGWRQHVFLQRAEAICNLPIRLQCRPPALSEVSEVAAGLLGWLSSKLCFAQAALLVPWFQR